MKFTDNTAEFLFDKKAGELEKGKSIDELGINCEKTFSEEMAECDSYLEQICKVTKENYIANSSQDSEFLSYFGISQNQSQLTYQLTSTFSSEIDKDTVNDDTGATIDSEDYGETSGSQTPAEELKEGDKVGPCEIIKFVGKGGNGIVYSAKHIALGIEVAIKFLTEKVCREPSVVSRFMKEAQAMARMRHQNILRVYDCGRYGSDNCFIVMDFVRGSDLKDFLENRKGIDLETCYKHMKQISSAMAEVHKEGIVHRDIKPANVLINDKGEAILMDFGIAKDYKSNEIQMTLETQTMGTPHYMSPEQIEATSKVTAAADIYSLGITFYEMLSGVRPINGKTLREILVKHATEIPEPVTSQNEAVPTSISSLIERMLAKEASDRPQNGEQLVKALTEAISQIGCEQEESSEEENKDDQVKKFPVSLVLAAVAIVSVIIVVLIFNNKSDEDPASNVAETTESTEAKPDTSATAPIEPKPDITDKVPEVVKQDPAVPEPVEKPIELSSELINKAILEDLKLLPPEEHKNYRYFSFANLEKLSVNKENLDIYRFGLTKLLNSLSTASSLKVPSILKDTKETIYRVNLKEFNWSTSLFEEMMKHYPHKIKSSDPSESKISSLVKTENFLVRADWFTFIASKEPFYSRFLKQPKVLSKLESELGIDRLGNIKNANVIRSGFNNSGVSSSNRLIERHNSTNGYFWVSYDFSSNSGKSNIFNFPGNPSNFIAGEGAFEHHGNGIIYQLPNKMQAYYIASSKGEKLNSADSKLMFDSSSSGQDKINNGISCITCHQQGIKKASDEVRPYILKNAGRYSQKIVDYVKLRYPERSVLDAIINKDLNSFQKALEQLAANLFKDEKRVNALLINLGLRSGKLDTLEPVKHLYNSYGGKVYLSSVVADFEVSSEKLESLAQENHLFQSLKANGLGREMYNGRLSEIAEQLGKTIVTPQSKAASLYKKPVVNEDVIRFTGVEQMLGDLQKKLIRKDSNLVLGDFNTRTVSNLSIFFRKSLARAIKNSNSYHLLSENELNSYPGSMEEIINSYGSSLSVSGVDYILGGQIQEEGSKLNLSLKVADIENKKIHKFVYEIYLKDFAGKQADTSKMFEVKNAQKSMENIQSIEKISKAMPENFKLTLSCNGDGDSFFEGESMIFNVTSSEDAYIILIGHQIDGSSVLLFPNQNEMNNLVKANAHFTFPTKSNYDIQVQEPFGRDILQIVAFKEKESLEKFLKDINTQQLQGLPYSIIDRSKMIEASQKIKGSSSHIEKVVKTMPKQTRGLKIR